MSLTKTTENMEAGNIYAVPLNNQEYFFFRVLLMVEKQCIETKKIEKESELTFFSSCGLIEIFRDTSQKTDTYNDKDILVSGLFCSFSSFVKSGKWIYAGFREVNPQEIYFPAFVQSLGFNSARYIRGEIAIPFEIGMKDVEKIGIFPQSFPGAGLFVFYLYNADRKIEIPSNYENLDRFALSKKDLYFSEHLNEIRKYIGPDIDLKYAVLSKKFGFDIARFYAD